MQSAVSLPALPTIEQPRSLAGEHAGLGECMSRGAEPVDYNSGRPTTWTTKAEVKR